MNDTIQTLENLLFADAETRCYAIVDGASAPSLLGTLDQFHPPTACLYRGELRPDIEQVAPYLIELVPEERFAAWLLEEGWGKHFGIFFWASEPLDVMRLHFRRMLRVYDEGGNAKLFRYYDPRVLNVFLPTCVPEQLDQFFGPVSAFLAESENGAGALRYRRRKGALVAENHSLAPAGAWEPIAV